MAEAAKLSAVAEDYVKVIYAATEFGGEPLSVTRIATRIGVAASTASEMVRRLVTDGLVDHRPYGGVELTAAGRLAAVRMVRRHRLLETYLCQRLGYDWDEVHEDAEILEHAASDRLIAAIDKALDYPRVDPHGDPIPAPDGSVAAIAAQPCLEFPPATELEVCRISDEDAQLLRYLATIGVGVGTRLTISARHDVAGTASVIITTPHGRRETELGLVALECIFCVPVPGQLRG